MKFVCAVLVCLLLFAILVSPVCASQSFSRVAEFMVVFEDYSGGVLGVLFCHLEIHVYYGDWQTVNGSETYHFESSDNQTHQSPLRSLSLIDESATYNIVDQTSWWIAGAITIQYANRLDLKPGESQTEGFGSPTYSYTENGQPKLVNDPAVYIKHEFTVQVESSDGQRWSSRQTLAELTVTKQDMTYHTPQVQKLRVFQQVSPSEWPPNPEYARLQEAYENLEAQYNELKTEQDQLSQVYKGLLEENSAMKSQLGELQKELDKMNESYETLLKTSQEQISDLLSQISTQRTFVYLLFGTSISLTIALLIQTRKKKQK